MDHINGNWRIATEQTNMLYIEEDQGRGFRNPTVCLLYQDVTPTDSVGCIDLEALPNAAANARLIAAAPALLAALEEILRQTEWMFSLADERWHGLDEAQQSMVLARAAIARARGVSE